jgi:hypothetical protein
VEVARVVSEMETSSTMRPVLRILGTVEGPHFKSAYLSRLAGDCIRRSLDSDSRAWLALQRDLGGLDVEVLGCVADCLAGGLTVHERQLQIDLLGRDVALDTRILANFLKLELRASRRMRELAVTRVVDLAESPSKVVRKLALLVLGHWREADSIHLMIANLEHEQRSVSRAALTALRQVSGLSWPGDAERWRNWHTEQLSWLAEASPDLRERITSDDLSVSMRACRDLGLHGLWRAHLVPVVASTLEQVDVPVVIASIEALQELDAFGAIAVLIPMLDDSNEKVQFAAQAALESITANALDPSRSGADSSAWWSWLEG